MTAPDSPAQAEGMDAVIEQVLSEAYSRLADEPMKLKAGTVSMLVNELKTLRFLAQQPAAGPAPAEALEKVALWDALMGSAELRHVGSAGLTPDSRQWESNYAHLGLALTTHRSVNETDPDPNPRGREMLMAFLKKRGALADAEAGS